MASALMDGHSLHSSGPGKLNTGHPSSGAAQLGHTISVGSRQALGVVWLPGCLGRLEPFCLARGDTRPAQFLFLGDCGLGRKAQVLFKGTGFSHSPTPHTAGGAVGMNQHPRAPRPLQMHVPRQSPSAAMGMSG